MELIVDAASQCPSAGLSSRGIVGWTSGPLSPREHTRQLLPAILTGLKAMSATFDDLEVIIVSLGPGPFNGLRVAVSTAKGLAAGTGAAVVGISTLEAEAYRCEPSTAKVRPIVCAGQTGFTTALFSWREVEWVQVEDNRHIEVPEVADFLGRCECICGDVEDVLATLPPMSPRGNFSAAISRCSRLEVLASLGWERYLRGHITSATALQPLYARPPHITAARDRRP